MRIIDASELIPGFVPENELERTLLQQPEVGRGLAWGSPRAGHPEGAVGRHVADLLRTVDEAGESGEQRRMLRFVALLHDTFKYSVRDWLPKTGSNHHAMRARRFAERFTDDERILATIELHDRPYSLWRRMRRTGRDDPAALDGMLERLPDRDLFARFVEIDGSTEGKDPRPTEWLREELVRRGAGAARSA